MQKDDEIVTFETYYDLMLAEIIRAKLEANGIDCFIADESLGALFPVFDNGSGGVKIKVFARDVDKCKAIIAADTELPNDEDIEAEK
jgi:hypothetical protein